MFLIVDGSTELTA